MSYFMGDDGKRYFPFGRGGRENLLRGCGILQGHSSSGAALTSSSEGSSGGCDGSHAPHEHTDACRDSSSTSSHGMSTSKVVVNESFQRLQDCPLHILPIYTRDSDSGEASLSQSTIAPDSTLPICITEPESQPAAVYRALAKDVVLEVFKNQVSALLVSLLFTLCRYPLVLVCSHILSSPIGGLI